MKKNKENESGNNKSYFIKTIFYALLPISVMAAIAIQKPFSNENDTQMTQVSAYENQPSMSVDVFVLKNENIMIKTKLDGRVSAFEKAEIRPQISGIIEKKLFKDGDYVKAGQVLFKIDNSVYNAELKIASSSLNYAMVEAELAKKKRDRYKNLVDQKAVSKQDFDETQAEFEKLNAVVLQRKADYDLAKIKLDYTDVKSPIDGYVDISAITIGELVVENQANMLTKVTNIDKVYVDLEQSYNDYIDDLNRTVLNTKQAHKNVEIEKNGLKIGENGMLISTGKIVDKNTGSVKLRAVFDNKDGLLIDGLYVVSNIIHGLDVNGIIIPQSSVSKSINKPNSKTSNSGLVKVVVNGIIESRTVVIDRAVSVDGKNYYLLSSGLSSGDKVVVGGGFKTSVGDSVSVNIINSGDK